MTKKIHKITVGPLEAAKGKYEGKWIVTLSLDGGPAATYWMSHKQMTSVQKVLDKPVIFAAFDYEKAEQYGKPRFIWATSDRQWLAKTFLGEADTFTVPPAEAKAKVQAIINNITEEDIPF